MGLLFFYIGNLTPVSSDMFTSDAKSRVHQTTTKIARSRQFEYIKFQFKLDWRSRDGFLTSLDSSMLTKIRCRCTSIDYEWAVRKANPAKLSPCGYFNMTWQRLEPLVFSSRFNLKKISETVFKNYYSSSTFLLCCPFLKMV